jgi:SHS2 domain-containing protein
MGYKLIDHTADLGFEVISGSERGLFADAVLAMFDLIADLDGVQAAEQRNLTIEGMDRTDLLINFLRETLYLFNGEGFLLKEVAVTVLSDIRIVATVSVENYDPDRHTIKTELKAVTYHQAYVRKIDGIWKAQVIFDV